MAVPTKRVSLRLYLSGVKSLQSRHNLHGRDHSDRKVANRLYLKPQGQSHLQVLDMVRFCESAKVLITELRH